MQKPPRPAAPLDYRPHSEDAAARRWPLWVGLAVTAVVIGVGLLLLTRRAVISPPPLAATPAPASQPAWSTTRVSAVPSTQPTANPAMNPTTGPATRP